MVSLVRVSSGRVDVLGLAYSQSAYQDPAEAMAASAPRGVTRLGRLRTAEGGGSPNAPLGLMARGIGCVATVHEQGRGDLPQAVYWWIPIVGANGTALDSGLFVAMIGKDQRATRKCRSSDSIRERPFVRSSMDHPMARTDAVPYRKGTIMAWATVRFAGSAELPADTP